MEKIVRKGTRRTRLYRGFSSYNYELKRTHHIYDVECVKVDLLNHIMTRRGSRLMMPQYGTRIPDMLFEQVTEELLELIEDDLREVVNYDPRVEFLDEYSLLIKTDPDQNKVTAAMTLRYIELEFVDVFNLNLQFGQ